MASDRCNSRCYSTYRVSDASGKLEVSEVGQKPLKREHLDSNVSCTGLCIRVREIVLVFVLVWFCVCVCPWESMCSVSKIQEEEDN